MKMLIQNKAGRWLVNGNKWEDLTLEERHFMEQFFNDVKLKSTADATT